MKGLGVFGKELGAVGGVEAFREDNQACAGLRGLKDLASGIRKVNSFVRACRSVSLKAASKFD